LRVDEQAREPYKLKWDLEAPYVNVGVTDDGTFLADAALEFSDLLGNHRFRVLASTVSDFANYEVTYLNLKRRFDWGASFYDYRDYYLQAGDSGAVNQDQVNRRTAVYVTAMYPFSRYYRVEGSAGVLDTSQDVIAGFDSDGSPNFDNLSNRFLTFRLGLSGDTTRWQSFGPFQGKRFNIEGVFAPYLSGDQEGNIREYHFDFRAYKQATRRSVFAFRVASILNPGDWQSDYGFGGVNQLRGFEFREFVGSNLAWTNLEFRFPLVDEMRFPVMALANIRGMFFLDVGAAWLDNDLFYDPDFRSPSGFTGGVRVDAGGNPEPFRFWDSDEGRLQDGRGAYGVGFQFFFIGGLQFNWVWSKRLDYTQFDCSGSPCVKAEANSGDTRSDFYIYFDW
jgi:hypothetical protein